MSNTFQRNQSQRKPRQMIPWTLLFWNTLHVKTKKNRQSTAKAQLISPELHHLWQRFLQNSDSQLVPLASFKLSARRLSSEKGSCSPDTKVAKKKKNVQQNLLLASHLSYYHKSPFKSNYLFELDILFNHKKHWFDDSS